ncbi:MAG TPA: protein kinase [Pyrinomonadaceae bacterium]|jgi:serine/threonine-protein kinase|nr:protein kinase [Pyrinomonadaceae bacterium]
MTSCPKCSAPVAPEDRFCGNCGVVINSGAVQPGASVRGSAALFNDAPPPSVASTGDLSAPAPDLSRDAGNEQPPEPRMEAGAQSSAAAVAPAHGDDADVSDASGNSDASGDAEFDEQLQPTIIGPPTEVSAALASVEESAEESAAPNETDAPPFAAPSRPQAQTGEQSPTTGEQSSGVGSRNVGVAAESHLPPQTPAEPRTSRKGSTGNLRGTARQLEPATVLNGRYEIVRRIGGGGMGAVYYAKDRNLGDAPRAVKEMIQSQLDESQHEKAIGDFKRESMLLASLEHRSIPTIYDYFYELDSGRFYLVMKYISGGDFLARLRNAPGGRIDELTVADWAVQVADVLDYLHNQRPPIIYRDLKPANLMIDGNNGRVMLIDFGIARWVQKEEKGVTAVGTMGYAPPELFSGKVEPRSDIYSLGATMFHLVTGADPQDNPLLIFDFTKHPRPRQINPALSNEMERILMRAVEYNTESRFRSAAEMRDVLAAHLEKLRAGAVTYGSSGASADHHDAKTIAVDMVYCGFCGGRIAGDDVFCAHCGARQPLAAASAGVRAARATAKLIVAGTTELDATFQLHKDSSLVGRSDPHSNIFPEIDLSKFDPETKISRRHARIWRQGDTYLVEDLGSVNGTVINDSVKLGPRQPRTLENGDRLRLGETTLHFLVG